MYRAPTAKPDPTGKWKIERIHDKKNGYRGISIFDEQGLRVANIVMQLDESEMEKARLIVDAVNAYRKTA